MIDWIKAEYGKIRIILKTGETYTGSGSGLCLAEDFDDPEEQYDTFFVATKEKGLIALSIDEIEDVLILKD